MSENIISEAELSAIREQTQLIVDDFLGAMTEIAHKVEIGLITHAQAEVELVARFEASAELTAARLFADANSEAAKSLPAYKWMSYEREPERGDQDREAKGDFLFAEPATRTSI
jgi:hypothetical protein